MPFVRLPIPPSLAGIHRTFPAGEQLLRPLFSYGPPLEAAGHQCGCCVTSLNCLALAFYVTTAFSLHGVLSAKFSRLRGSDVRGGKGLLPEYNCGVTAKV